MSAKTAAQRKAEQRDRDKRTEEQRLARRISLDLFKGTDMALIRLMARLGIEEEQDVISRLIHGADRLDDRDLETLTRLS